MNLVPNLYLSIISPHLPVLVYPSLLAVLFPVSQADEKIALMQERVAKAKATIDTSAPRGWAEKHSADGSSSPSKAKVSARERSELIALDNMLLARRIFNIMEAPSAISEIINDTRHLDVHPGTMNYKHRVEESDIIHRDNLIIANRLHNIKPYYGYSDLNANRGMLGDKHKAKGRKEKPKKPAAKQAQGEAPPVSQSKGGSLSARGPAPPRSQNQSQPVSGSQSARGASTGGSSAKSVLPKGVLLRSHKMQDGKRIELIVVKAPQQDKYGVLGKWETAGLCYESSFTSEEVSTLVDGDLLVTNIEKPEVWEALFAKVTLGKEPSFSEAYAAVPAAALLNAAIAQQAAKKAQLQAPAKPKGNRPTSGAGGRAGKAKTGKDGKKLDASAAAAAAAAEKAAAAHKQIAVDIGDSAEVHGAATKLQAVQRAKKAKAHAEQLRVHKKAVAERQEEQRRVAEDIGNSAEVHGAASKLQALQRAKKAKAHAEQLRKEKEEKEKKAASAHKPVPELKLKLSSPMGAAAGKGEPLTLAQTGKSPQPKAPQGAPRQGNSGRAPKKAK